MNATVARPNASGVVLPAVPVVARATKNVRATTAMSTESRCPVPGHASPIAEPTDTIWPRGNVAAAVATIDAESARVSKVFAGIPTSPWLEQSRDSVESERRQAVPSRSTYPRPIDQTIGKPTNGMWPSIWMNQRYDNEGGRCTSKGITISDITTHTHGP